MRLYSVLGKRTGHEQPLPRAAEDRPALAAVPRTVEAVPDAREVANRNLEPKAEPGLRAIVAGEPGFDVARFLEGAQAAYRMVLEAFWRGDRAALRDLVTDDVYGSFDDAIKAREEAGQTLDNRLVSIEHAKVVDATLSGREARIVVRFGPNFPLIL